MDDLAETVLLNMFAGRASMDSRPWSTTPTKPLLGLRRTALAAYVAARGLVARVDESNDDLAFRRNRVRHQLLPLLNDVAERDVVPLLARQAEVLFDDREWLGELLKDDLARNIDDVDCRELRDWPRARLRRWLRTKLARRR